jgi:predicted dehydrogenase
MRIAVLGAGSIGSRHVKNLTELGHTVNVYDPNLYNNDRDYLIEWADAVVIATPTNQHAADLDLCLGLGRPVFVEKPLVGSIEDWSKVPTSHIRMVGYNLRFHSCVKKARELMGAGRIGRPIWARFTCAQYNDKPAYRRDGVVLNWSHEIDLAIYLIGVGEFVAAAVTKEDDMADIALTHERTGCQTIIHLDYLTKPERRGFMIVGEDGAIEADLVNRNLFLKDNRGKVVELFQGRDSWDGNYLDEMRKFIDRLNGKETIGCTAAEALLVNGICFQAKGVALAG